jgi:hypothetical protein
MTDIEAALRALRDCRVIRARVGHPGYGKLFDQRLANATRVANADHLLDYNLTPAGYAAAQGLPPILPRWLPTRGETYAN